MRRPAKAAALAFAALLCGCADMQTIAVTDKTCTPMPCKVVAAAYSTTWFQDRYMSKTIAIPLLGPLIGGIISDNMVDYSARKRARLEANAFERGLGDFDTSEYFLQGFKQRIGDARLMKFDLATDTATQDRVLAALHSAEPWKMKVTDASGQPLDRVGAFRVAYGIGVRRGSEQLGFDKTYRAFIRVIAQVKDVHTGNVLWQAAPIAFGDKGYKGDDANPDRIPPAELVAAFKQLTPQVIDLLIQSLDGKALPEMPILNDTDNSDFAF